MISWSNRVEPLRSRLKICSKCIALTWVASVYGVFEVISTFIDLNTSCWTWAVGNNTFCLLSNIINMFEDVSVPSSTHIWTFKWKRCCLEWRVIKSQMFKVDVYVLKKLKSLGFVFLKTVVWPLKFISGNFQGVCSNARLRSLENGAPLKA